MFGLSPLSTGHPLRFQPKWVRPSTGSYPRFSLPMDSSPGFASTACDCARHLKDSLSLRLASKLNLAAYRDSLAHSTKGTPSPREGGSDCLWAHGFRYCFTPLPGCFSPFPHGTMFAIGHRRVFSLGGWSPLLHTGFHVPGITRVRATRAVAGSAHGALTLHGRPSHAVGLPVRYPRRGCWAPRNARPTTPRAAAPQRCDACTGLGCCAFARRYSRNLG